ncbi:MAG: hypothetical protein QOG20_5356 [Pseudonocardiales bacterium]|nr:hypothetical protein [Pseudonocardiales bacterium]
MAVEEVTAFRARARAWLAEAEIPGTPLDLDERFAVHRRWQRTLYDAGWMGIAWPRRFGGQGLTAQHQLAFVDELVRARAPAPIGLIGLDVVGPSIHAFGTDAQRERFLPRLLSGVDIWCQGFSEPGAGSDLASLTTRAEPDGDEFVVTGAKVWTSWAHEAAWCALLCRTNPTARKHEGISYLLVDMTSPGITVRPIAQMTGDAEFNEVFLDHVRVSRENVLGEVDGGWRIALDTLGRERGSYTMRRRVELEAGLAEAVAQLRSAPESRRSDPRVQEEVGRAHIALRLLEAQTRRTLTRMLDGSGAGPLDSVDKLVLNDAEQVVCRSVAELLGPFRVAPRSRPLGLDAGRWVHDHYYSRAASIYGGTAQIQRNIVAERLLGLPRG